MTFVDSFGGVYDHF